MSIPIGCSSDFKTVAKKKAKAKQNSGIIHNKV